LPHPNQHTPLLIFDLARQQTSSPGALFCSSYSRNFFASTLFFPRRNPAGNSLLKKMRPNAIDVAITLRRWNMAIPILRVELAKAKERLPSQTSTP